MVDRPAPFGALLMLLAASACASTAELPKPEVPDPYGLGERLALVDYLRDQLHVTPPAGATLEQLTELYWQKTGQRRPRPDTDDDLARDRMARMRRELQERYRIDAPAGADEPTLGKLLAAAKREASEQGLKEVVQRAEAHDHPATPEDAARVAAADAQAIRARLDGLEGDVRSDQAAIAGLERKHEQLKADYLAGQQQLEALAGRAEEARRAHQRAAAAYDHELETAGVATDRTRAAMEDAAAADAAAHAACDRQVAKLKALVADDDALGQQRDRLQQHLAELDRRQAEASGQLQAAQARRGADASPQAPGTQPAGAPPAATGLEGRIKAAVVLLRVEGRGTGTGFFVGAGGLMVTNAHVVGDGKLPITALWDGSARHAPVRMRVVQVLEADDLALLRADGGGGFQVLELREQYDLARPLLAVGFPLAGSFAATLQTSPTDIVISRGALSSVRHKGEVAEWLQHDCKIASGNSGGPLIDQESGAVIGINTMVISPEAAGGHGDSMSLAIPVRKVKERFAAQLGR